MGMISDKKINRINELANKKKKQGLTDEEQKEQDALRKEYLQGVRGGMRKHIEGMKVVDPDGKDVTPEKLKKIQKKKGLHDR